MGSLSKEGKKHVTSSNDLMKYKKCCTLSKLGARTPEPQLEINFRRINERL